MPMNLKDEIMAGESYALEFKRVPNEEREKYLKTVVAFANGYLTRRTAAWADGGSRPGRLLKDS